MKLGKVSKRKLDREERRMIHSNANVIFLIILEARSKQSMSLCRIRSSIALTVTVAFISVYEAKTVSLVAVVDLFLQSVVSEQEVERNKSLQESSSLQLSISLI